MVSLIKDFQKHSKKYMHPIHTRKNMVLKRLNKIMKDSQLMYNAVAIEPTNVQFQNLYFHHITTRQPGSLKKDCKANEAATGHKK